VSGRCAKRGLSNVNPFHPFSTEHGLIVLIGFAAIAVFLVCGRCGGSIEISTTRTLAWLNLAAYPVGLISWILQGDPLGPEHYLPFHLCDIAAITAGIALLTKHRLASALTYFWGLAGTIQGLLTPAIEIGFPEPGCLTFFLQHFAIVAASLYLPIIHGWRPRRPFWKEITGIFVWSLAYLVFALVTNSLTGANFGYASHPPVNPSLLDHLGPWPWYLLTVQGIALILYSMLCLPFVRNKPLT